MENAKPRANDRLSIAYILSVTTGVSIIMFLDRQVQQLRAPADIAYYGEHVVSEYYLYQALSSIFYGVLIATFVFAYRSGNLWLSPGKTLVSYYPLVYAVGYVLELTAAIVMYYRMRSGTPDPFVSS